MGQKLSPLPPVNEAWKKRIGKKYIVCDAHPDDLVLNTDGFYVTIKEYENEDGLLFFLHPKPYDMTPLPVITSGDNETEMVLNTPLGSSDGFAPFIYEKGGIEYLYAFGYNLIDTAYLKPLQTGQVISGKGRENKVFSITSRLNINVDIPNGVRVIIYDSDLKLKYDSTSGQKISETCDGFILFMGEGSVSVAVEVCS